LIFLVLPLSLGTSYLRSNQQLIAKVHDEGGIDYYQLDAFNNVRSMFNDSICLKDIQDYLPFGRGIYKTLETLQYKSEIREWTSNLYGPYSPDSGRFMVARPSMTFSDPQTLNAYTFSGNNPYRRVTPEVPGLYNLESLFEAPSGARSKGSVSGSGPLIAASAPNFIKTGGMAHPRALIQPLVDMTSRIISFSSFIRNTCPDGSKIPCIGERPDRPYVPVQDEDEFLDEDIIIEDIPMMVTETYEAGDAWTFGRQVLGPDATDTDLVQFIHKMGAEYPDLIYLKDGAADIYSSNNWQLNVQAGDELMFMDDSSNMYVWNVCTWKPGGYC